MKVLLTGASGFLGRYLSARLSKEHEVVGASSSVADFSLPGTAEKLFDDVLPGAIVHAAARTRPDLCEKDPETAYAVNERATGELAARAAKYGVRLIYISTDLVFDGEGAPYREVDEPNPLGVYGASKLAGEKAVLEAGGEGLVMRLSWSYGWGVEGVPSFCDEMMRRVREEGKMPLFSDQVRSVLYAEDASEMISRTLMATAPPKKILHMAGPESMTRLKFGQLFFDTFGLDQAKIEETKMADLGLAAKRPKDSSLDGGVLERWLNFQPGRAQDRLTLMRAEGPIQGP